MSGWPVDVFEMPVSQRGGRWKAALSLALASWPVDEYDEMIEEARVLVGEGPGTERVFRPLLPPAYERPYTVKERPIRRAPMYSMPALNGGEPATPRQARGPLFSFEPLNSPDKPSYYATLRLGFRDLNPRSR